MQSVLVKAVLCLSIVLGARGSSAQLSPDEALAKLKAKQQAHEADRSKPAQISQGDLEDLRAELVKVKAELAALKSQAGKSGTDASVATAAAAPVKLVPKIAVGITREELLRFVTVHKAQYEITSDAPTADGGPPKASEAWNGTVTVTAKARRKVYTGIGSNGIARVSEYREEMRPDMRLMVTVLAGHVSGVQETKVPEQRDERDPLAR